MTYRPTMAACSLLLLIVHPAIAHPQQVTPQPGEEAKQTFQQAASFDGDWGGTIYFDKEAFLSSTGTPDTGVKYLFEINGPVVRVSVIQHDEVEELKPGMFHLAAVETNAIIFATEAAPNGWVESVAFTMTQKDTDTLLVEFSRVINNRILPLTEKESKYATRGAGEFKRAKSFADH